MAIHCAKAKAQNEDGTGFEKLTILVTDTFDSKFKSSFAVNNTTGKSRPLYEGDVLESDEQLVEINQMGVTFRVIDFDAEGKPHFGEEQVSSIVLKEGAIVNPIEHPDTERYCGMPGAVARAKFSTYIAQHETASLKKGDFHSKIIELVYTTDNMSIKLNYGARAGMMLSL